LAKNEARPKDKRLPRKKVKVSVTEPEAPLGRDKEKVFGPMYTTEFVVDTASLLILSFDVFAQATDAGTLAPMLDRTREVTGTMLSQISTDAGYVSLLDLQECRERNVRLVAPVQENDFTEEKRAKAGESRIGKDEFEWLPEEQTYRCPQGYLLNYKSKDRKTRRDDNTVTVQTFRCPAEHCRECPLRERCVRNPEKGRTVKRLEGEEIIEAHKAYMKTDDAKATNRLRGSVIERCFADAKAPSSTPAIAWSRSEESQGRDRAHRLSPNRPGACTTPEKCCKPLQKRGLKAGRSLKAGASVKDSSPVPSKARLKVFPPKVG
jgi:Transposase DDE domain